MVLNIIRKIKRIKSAHLLYLLDYTLSQLFVPIKKTEIKSLKGGKVGFGSQCCGFNPM